MTSFGQSTAMKTYTFDIRVALVGYVSVGKSTVLNALLGDKFSQVALKRTTAGVNFFRIIQPKEREGDKSTKAPPRKKWYTIGDDQTPKDAVVVHQEITKDNTELRSSETVGEKTFDIQVPYSICKMRKDTQLVLIDIPGINEAESDKKYKDYVKSNWKTFDCVVVVMDANEGVNTEEQVELLEFVHRNNQESKDIPTIVLGNKMDDLQDVDTISQIEETLSKTIEIFGDVDSVSMSHKSEEIEEVHSVPKDGKEIKTAFIPLSAKNAFTYMKAGRIDLEQLTNPKYKDLIEKIGSDEYGRKWSRMKANDKYDAVSEILRDPAELEERLASTNFDSFLATLSNIVGGDARQEDILAKQIDLELQGISYNSRSKKAFSKSILEVFQRGTSIGQIDIDGLKETFWKVYRECEKDAFEKRLETNVDPRTMERLFLELEEYHELSLLLEWTEDSVRTIDAMKALLRRQLSFLFSKLQAWSFESHCLALGGVYENRYYSTCGGDCYDYHQCRQTVSSNCLHCHFICGGNHQIHWSNGIEIPKKLTWQNLSPHDWIAIFDSLLLVWNQNCFIEDFGPEKMKLNAALMNFHGTLGSVFGLNKDFVATDEKSRLLLYACKEELKKIGKDDILSMRRVEMPNTITHSHWGFLAWKYSKFCNGLHKCE